MKWICAPTRDTASLATQTTPADVVADQRIGITRFCALSMAFHAEGSEFVSRAVKTLGGRVVLNALACALPADVVQCVRRLVIVFEKTIHLIDSRIS